jgi:hypothetical protein
MALTTYAGLQTAVAQYLHRSDLGAVIPDCITLAEERMNRVLRVRQMETALADTAIADGIVATPADTLAVKTLWVVGFEKSPLLSSSFEFIKSRGAEGVPAYFAWQGDSFHFDGSGTVAGVLYAKIPALSESDTSNWLLAAHPSAYLNGTLLEAAIYLRDEAAIAFHEARFTQVLDAIAGGDMRDRFSGPLVVRAR